MKLLHLLFRGFVTQIHNVTLCLWRRNEGFKCHFPRIWGPKIHKFSPRGQQWWPLTETLNQAKLPAKHFVNLTGLRSCFELTLSGCYLHLATWIRAFIHANPFYYNFAISWMNSIFFRSKTYIGMFFVRTNKIASQHYNSKGLYFKSTFVMT